MRRACGSSDGLIHERAANIVHTRIQTGLNALMAELGPRRLDILAAIDGLWLVNGWGELGKFNH